MQRNAGWQAIGMLLLVIVASCADDPNGQRSNNSRVPTADPYEATVAAGDASIELAVSAQMPPSLDDGQPSRRFSGTGVVDHDAGAAAVHFDWADVPNGAGYFGHTEQIDVVYHETGFVLSFDLLESALDGPARSVRYELDDFERARALQLGIGQLREVALSNPLLLLSFLKDTAASQLVGGEPATPGGLTEQELTIDLAAVAADTSPSLVETLAVLRDRLGSDETTVEVAVDQDGVLHRLYWDAKYPSGTGPGVVVLEVSMEFSDFGTEVEVDMPRENEIVDFDEYAGL